MLNGESNQFPIPKDIHIMRAEFLRLAVFALAAAAASSCGGGDSSSPTTPSSPSAGAVTITILDSGGTGNRGNLSFSPNPASAGGQTVVFKNNDSTTHRVVLNDGSIDTGDIAPGATSRSVVMPGVGTNYHCSLHTGMGGAVSPASGGAPPACEGPFCY